MVDSHDWYYNENISDKYYTWCYFSVKAKLKKSENKVLCHDYWTRNQSCEAGGQPSTRHIRMYLEPSQRQIHGKDKDKYMA